jgi:HEAT repeat protein
LSDKNKEFPLREIRRIKATQKHGFQFRCGNEPPPPILDPRALAARALGIIGDESARPALRRALEDKGEWLRSAASQALKDLDIKAARAQ